MTPDEQAAVLLARELARLADPVEREDRRREFAAQDRYLDEHYPGWREGRKETP